MVIQEGERRTIEQETSRLMYSRIQKFLAGEQNIHPVMHLKYAAVSEFPRLTHGEDEFGLRQRFDSAVYIDPDNGELLIARWGFKQTKIDEETRRYLSGEEFFTNITKAPYPNGRNPQLLEDMVKSGDVVQLIFSRTDTAEKAIRMQRKVRDKYDPEDPESEIQRIISIGKWLSGAGKRLELGNITAVELSEMKSEIAALLVRARYSTATGEEKKNIVKMALSAMGPDKSGRINTPASLMKIRSAKLDAAELYYKGKVIYSKYSDNLAVLTYERNQTRLVMEESLTSLSELEERIYTGGLKNSEYSQIAHQLRDISQQLTATTRLAPYLKSSRIVAALLHGDETGDRKKRDKKILSDVYDDLYSLSPATFSITSNRVGDAARNITWAKNLLQEVLSANAKIEKESEEIEDESDERENSGTQIFPQ